MCSIDSGLKPSLKRWVPLCCMAQKQGANAVMATRWPVADISTSLFMQWPCKLRNEKCLSKAEAMRQVQLEFLDPASKFSHPYFWVPFVLMGNWL